MLFEYLVAAICSGLAVALGLLLHHLLQPEPGDSGDPGRQDP